MLSPTQVLEQSLSDLSPAEQLRLARWLIDQAAAQLALPAATPPTRLMDLAGRYDGGPGDSAERVEDILAEEVRGDSGLSGAP